MPRKDPIPSPRTSMFLRFRKGMKYLSLLAIAAAAAAVFLVWEGSEGTHVHMLIATALGVGLMVLLGTGLMLLTFLSASSGHDDAAARHGDDQ